VFDLTARARKLKADALWFPFTISIGIVLGFWWLLIPPFDAVPGDYGDARFTVLLLEHTWQTFVIGSQASYWSPTWLFHPYQNSLAMAENMAGNFPLYAIYREIGLEPTKSYLAWFISCGIINFLSAYQFGRTLKLSRLGACIPAYLFAFSMQRISQYNHSQLMPHFFSCYFGIALYKAFLGKTHMQKWYLLAAAFLASWQFWASIYFGIFLALATGFVTASCLFIKDSRKVMLSGIRRNHIAILAAMALMLFLLYPLFSHYGAIKDAQGYRSWSEIRRGMMDGKNLLFPIPQSYLYHWLWDYMQKNHNPGLEGYQFTGFLTLTAPFLLIFLYIKRKASLSKTEKTKTLILLTSFFMALIFTVRGPEYQSPYYYLYKFLPGFGAIRQLGRFNLLLVLLSGILIQQMTAIGITQKRTTLYTSLTAALLLGVIAENAINRGNVFSRESNQHRIESIANLVKASQRQSKCKAFFLGLPELDWIVNNDAMWVSQLTGIPTLNGYSGNYPLGWDLYPTHKVTDSQIRTYIDAQNQKILKSDAICNIQLSQGSIK